MPSKRKVSSSQPTPNPARKNRNTHRSLTPQGRQSKGSPQGNLVNGISAMLRSVGKTFGRSSRQSLDENSSFVSLSDLEPHRNRDEASDSENQSDNGSHTTTDDEPDAPCILCGIGFYPKMIQCNHCSGRVCQPCTGLSDDRVKELEAPDIQWRCITCLKIYKAGKGIPHNPHPTVTGHEATQLTRIEKLLVEMSTKIDQKASVDDLKAVQSAMDIKMELFEKKVSSTIDIKVQTIIEQKFLEQTKAFEHKIKSIENKVSDQTNLITHTLNS
jgi:hypothetical protein